MGGLSCRGYDDIPVMKSPCDMNSVVREGSTISPRWAMVLFLVALCFHVYFATYNWTWGFMAGHEFRQAQTAIITEYIDKQDNFGMTYETPILGKPWAFPLEFPIYQWIVVGVMRGLDLKIFEAARSVSLGSFYIALPAFWILLGSLGISRGRRWIVLATTLFCPAHIFYSRAFLIDPMAMMFSAWFLAGFVRMMETRRWRWLVLCTLTGTVAGLIKSLVFAVWLFPAACYGAWCLWRSMRAPSGLSGVVSTCAWGLGAVVLPLTALKWWIGHTDAIKEVHRSAVIFTSKNLSVGNFGTFSLDSRVSMDTWRELWARWSEAIAEPGVIAFALGAGLLLCRRARDRRLVLLAVAMWMFGQLAFPYAYAFQDYYFYAGAAFLMFGFGVLASALWENGRGPLILRVAVALVPCVGMARAYAEFYFPLQKVKSHGGSGMAEALRDFLHPESVIMVLGHDWSAILPYYAKHRALMVRNGLEADYAYLDGAISDLKDEDIGALVIARKARANADSARFLIERLGLISTPVFTHQDAVVHVSPTHYEKMRLALVNSSYDSVKLADPYDASSADHLETYTLSEGASRVAFPGVKPGVWKYRIKFGFNSYPDAQRMVASLHPPADVWIRNPPQRGRVNWEYGLTDPSWNREVADGDKTDGVEFAVWAERDNDETQRRLLWSRYLNPRSIESDRGPQKDEFHYALEEGEQLVFTARPGASMSYDWAYLASLVVESIHE